MSRSSSYKIPESDGEQVECPFGPRSFALRPTRSQGYDIICDPDREVRPGDRVAIDLGTSWFVFTCIKAYPKSLLVGVGDGDTDPMRVHKDGTTKFARVIGSWSRE